MLEQPRGQCELGRGGEAQPDPAAQFDDQCGGRSGRREFDLHEADRRPPLGGRVPPAAEGGVMETVPPGEGSGGQPAGGQRGKQFSALGHLGAPSTKGMRGVFHRPHIYHTPLPLTRGSPLSRIPNTAIGCTHSPAKAIANALMANLLCDACQTLVSVWPETHVFGSWTRGRARRTYDGGLSFPPVTLQR